MDELIENFLGVFMAAFLLILFIANERRRKRIRGFYQYLWAEEQVNNLLVNKTDLLLLSLASLIVVVYFFAREYYITYLLPIEFLDIPFVNHTGIWILRASLLWLVILQFDIEQRLKNKVFDLNTHRFPTQRFFAHLKKHQRMVILMMLTGLFVTISSVGAIFVIVLGIVFYFPSFYKKFKLS